MAEALRQPLVLLFVGVFAALGVATLVGRRLAASGAGADAKRVATLTNLKDRIRAWWVIVAILAAAAIAICTIIVTKFTDKANTIPTE